MRLLEAFLVACLFTSFPAAAQSQPTNSSSEILITGHVKDALRSFVRSLSKEGPTGQISRWDSYVCPTIVGIEPAQAQFVEQHILQLGGSLRLRPGGSGCTTSLIVVFTKDADGFTADLVKAYPIDLRADGLAGLKSFATSSQAVRWISVSNECGGGGGCELPGSRLLKDTKPTLQAMVVVVDAKKLSGYSLEELSDYVALVALTNPPANAVQDSHSILSMFNRVRTTGSKFGLTAYDRAFLSGLYNIRLEDPAEVQRATILNRMRKDVGRDQTEVRSPHPK